MRFSVSEVLDWQRCPRVYWHRHVVRRGLPASDAMADGTFWHARSAWELSAGAALAEAELDGAQCAPPAEGEEQVRMAGFITSKLRDELGGWEVLELERQDAMALGAHELTGTPDGVVRNRQTNAIYALQWKTCAGSRPLEVLFDEVRVSLHECAYEAMVKRRYTGEHFGGTLLGVWRKLTAKQRAQGESCFVLHQVSRSQVEVDVALSELRAQADDMERASQVKSAFSLVSRRRECVSFNYRCQYFGVCHGSDSLKDERFVDVPDRYAALAVGEANWEAAE